MNNTDKLLRAFIEASGYETEGSIDISYGQVIKAGLWGVSAAANTEFKFFPATDEMPEAEYREVIRTTDYKVTKKPFNILSDDYTDEVMRLHKTIQETNTYNEELYLENLDLKKRLSK